MDGTADRQAAIERELEDTNAQMTRAIAEWGAAVRALGLRRPWGWRSRLARADAAEREVARLGARQDSLLYRLGAP